MENLPPTIPENNNPRALNEFLAGDLERLLAIMEHIPAFVSYVDTEARYRCISRHYEEYFGRQREQIIGYEMREILGEHAWQQVGPALQRALQGEIAQFEAHFTVIRRGMRWARGSFLPHKDEAGVVRGVVTFVHDITEQKHYEQQLKDKDAFYRSIFESRGVMNIETDCEEGRILRVNRLTCELLGYEESELINEKHFLTSRIRVIGRATMRCYYL